MLFQPIKVANKILAGDRPTVLDAIGHTVIKENRTRKSLVRSESTGQRLAMTPCHVQIRLKRGFAKQRRHSLRPIDSKGVYKHFVVNHASKPTRKLSPPAEKSDEIETR